jgi:hypothetical protein
MGAADRVRKLAALAGSDNEHEANSAARQACRIIREGNVTISEARREEAGWYDPRGPGPSPQRQRRARPIPRGPFARRHDVSAVACASCDEEIPAGDAFSCADGYVHGDCIPASQRP